MEKTGRKSIIQNVFVRIFIAQILMQLVGIAGSVIDGMVTGQFLGEEAMAAFSFTSAVSMTVAMTGSVISMGTSVVCGKLLGKGEEEKTRHAFFAGATLAVFLAFALCAAVFVFAGPLASVLGAKGEVLAPCVAYLRGYAFAAPPIILVAFAVPIVQMEGKLTRLLLSVAVMTAGDIAADLLNVMVFHGGMFGMALATALSSLAAFFVVLPLFFRKKGIFTRPRFSLDFPAIKTILISGFPSAAAQCGRLLMVFVLNRMLMSVSGSLAVGAFGVITNAGNLLLVPGSAIGDTAQLLGGVLSGEEDRRGIVDLFRTGLKLGVLVNAVCIVFFEFQAPFLTGMFMQEGSGLRQYAIPGFRFYILCLIFYAVNGLYRCFCQGSGQTKRSLVITTLDCLVFPLAASLVILFLFGVPAVWLGQAAGEGMLTLGLFLWAKRLNAGCEGTEALIPFPKALGADHIAVLDRTIEKPDPEQAGTLSQDVWTFCLEMGADSRTAYHMSLAAEEIVDNVLKHGFRDGKRHRIEIRMIRKEDGWILRTRDDCTLFDPAQYLEQYTGDDPFANIGLKMLRAASRDIVYLNTLSLNNLIVTL